MVFVTYDDAFCVMEMQTERDGEVILSVWFDQNGNQVPICMEPFEHSNFIDEKKINKWLNDGTFSHFSFCLFIKQVDIKT